MPEPTAEEIAAHHDRVLTAAQRLGQDRQNQGLPLIAGMDLEHAILLERQRIDWLEREMHHGAGRVRSLQPVFRGRERRVDPWVVDEPPPTCRVCDQLGRPALQICLGHMRCVA